MGHVAASTITNANFVTEFPGFNFYQTWANNVYYAAGDAVRHGGYLYIANANNYGSSSPSEDIANWSILSKAVNFQGVWDDAVNYKIGDLVTRGGNLYVAVADTTSDGSSLNYLDAGQWEIVTTGQAWREGWSEDQTYSVNDLVIYLGSTYK